MRFGKPIRTNVAFNSGSRKKESTYDVLSVISYEAPLPMAPGGTTDGTTTSTTTGGFVGVGGTGNWAFAETIEPDGVSLLNLKYKEQDVHAFLAR
jgi:hypothetical protein